MANFMTHILGPTLPQYRPLFLKSHAVCPSSVAIKNQLTSLKRGEASDGALG